MSWKDDLQQIHNQNKILNHHKTLLAYTTLSVRKAIKEMRESEGPLSEVMKERAKECENSLEAILEFHNS